VGSPVTRLRLRVSPGASRSEVVGRYGDGWKVRVAARPEHGKANAAVLELVAQTLGMPKTSIDLVSGAGSRDKVLAVQGMDATSVEQLLAAATGAVAELGVAS
jgi:uncharacterized protein